MLYSLVIVKHYHKSRWHSRSGNRLGMSCFGYTIYALNLLLNFVVWIYDTFDNSSGIMNTFTKKNQEELLIMFWITFTPSNISQLCFCLQDRFKFGRLLLFVVSINGLNKASNVTSWPSSSYRVFISVCVACLVGLRSGYVGICVGVWVERWW